MAVIQDININVYAQPSEKRLRTFLTLSQNENGRLINFRILGAPLPSNCTATFSGTKPDGNVYSTTGTVTGNFVVVAEDMQMTAVAGVWDAKLDIINGTHNIMTALIRVVVDADVVDPDAIASDSQLQGLVAEAKYYAEEARIESFGAPLTAALKADMLDHTRVYVYTGSETGMTAGHWYYWNGSAWTDGGVYNAAALDTDKTLSVPDKAADGKATGDALALKVDKVTGKGLSTNDYTTAEKTKLSGIAEGATKVEIDSTLSTAGKAADAKKTGDEISQLKSELTGIVTTHRNYLQGANYYDGAYWKRSNPLDRTFASTYKAFYGIDVEANKTYYYKHIFLYYSVIVYEGTTTVVTLTDDTTQDVSGTFTPEANGKIYLTYNKTLATPLFTDDEELYNSNTFETYYTPNNLIVTKTEEDLSFTLTNGKAISNATGNESSANTYWNASSFVDVSGYQKIKVYSAFQNTLAAAFYDENQTFIVGVPADSGHSGTAYEYNLDTPPSAKYIRFTVYTYQSGVTADTAYIKGVIKQLDDVSAELKSIDNVVEEPVTKLPVYIKGLLSYRQIGCLDKGYICMTCDDGSAGLATYTIPMLAQKEVPATFGLFATSDVVNNETYLQTVLNAIADGCAVAMHGVASWSAYSEYYLNRYFEDTETALSTKGITEITGAICPGVGGYDDTSELIQCVAGGRYGSVCSGGTHGEISYGSYYCAGKRTNIYAMRRISIIRLTEAQYKAAIDYAYDNHLIFMPFWHDYDIVDNSEYKAIIEGMIDYAKSKGLTFITMKDLPFIK